MGTTPETIKERQRLEAEHGQLFTTEEVLERYEILSFCYNRCDARRLSDRVRVRLGFQHSPRFYWGLAQ